jgi:hypothetical protein
LVDFLPRPSQILAGAQSQFDGFSGAALRVDIGLSAPCRVHASRPPLLSGEAYQCLCNATHGRTLRGRKARSTIAKKAKAAAPPMNAPTAQAVRMSGVIPASISETQ